MSSEFDKLLRASGVRRSGLMRLFGVSIDAVARGDMPAEVLAYLSLVIEMRRWRPNRQVRDADTPAAEYLVDRLWIEEEVG